MPIDTRMSRWFCPPHASGQAAIARSRIVLVSSGIQRPERERRLSRPGDPGEDDQRIARDLDRDVLEVVLARPADADVAVVAAGGGRGGVAVTLGHGLRLMGSGLVGEGRNGLTWK